MHPGNNTLSVNMTNMGENKCEGESETVKVNQGQWEEGESGSLLSSDDIHVICKTYFEEGFTFNNLVGQ